MALGAAHTHYSKLLTGISVLYTNPAYVADLIVKPYTVTQDNDVYTVFDKTGFTVVNDVRADRASENEIQFGWKYEPYRIEYHGLKDAVTDKQRRNADQGLDLDATSIEVIKDMILLAKEQRVFGSGGLLRTAANNVGSANIDWTTLTSASPRGDVETGINAVEAASGRTPNTIAMAPNVMRWIMRTSEYREETKYTVNLSTQGGAEDLPDSLYGMKVVYVGALINTAKKGLADSLDRLMADDIWLGYVHPGESLGQKILTHSACIWTEEYARKWRDDDIEADWMAYNLNYVNKVVAKECGYLLTSVLTA